MFENRDYIVASTSDMGLMNTFVFIATVQCFFWYGGLLLAHYNYNGLVAPRLSFVQYLVSFHLVCFCVLAVFSAALPYTVHLVTNLQGLGKTRWTLDLPAPKRTHLPPDYGLVYTGLLGATHSWCFVSIFNHRVFPCLVKTITILQAFFNFLKHLIKRCQQTGA